MQFRRQRSDPVETDIVTFVCINSTNVTEMLRDGSCDSNCLDIRR